MRRKIFIKRRRRPLRKATTGVPQGGDGDIHSLANKHLRVQRRGSEDDRAT